MSLAATERTTYAAYLALEAETFRKHELESGVVTMMVGGSRDHSLIASNLGAALRVQLRGRPCRTFQADHKVWVGLFDSAYYPDVSVVCGPAVPAAHDRHATTNPTLIAEVLSPGTRGRDTTTKLVAYKALPSVRHIVFVDSERVLVMIHSRTPDGRWDASEAYTLDDTVCLDLHGAVDLPLHDLYDGAEFLQPPADPSPEPPQADAA